MALSGKKTKRVIDINFLAQTDGGNDGEHDGMCWNVVDMYEHDGIV
jgi:hypothetical protein